ncbi:MAG: DMT family transporter [Pseudomonadota bacterium]
MSTALRPREDRLTAAVLILFGAFFCFTLIDSSAKWLVAAGLPALQVVFIRYAGHFLVAIAWFLPMEGIGVFRSNAPGIQIARAAMLMGGTTLNFIALAYLPLTITTAIFFAAPVLVSLLAIPILGEQIGPRRFVAILVGFTGVLIIAAPWGVAFHWSIFAAIGALVCASMYFVLTRMIAGVDNNPTGQVITSGLPALALLPFVLGNWTWPVTTVDWSVTCLIGLFGALGHSLLTVGYRYAPASTLAPVVYVQIIYATVISWAVFAQPPDAKTIAGTALIIAAGVYIWRRERQIRATPTG